MLRSVMLAMARSRLVKRVALSIPATRAMVDRFVPGETVDQAMIAVHRLADAGLMVTIDFLGEDTRNHRQADLVTDTYLELLQRIRTAQLGDRVEVSVKLSALGSLLSTGRDLALENVRTICEAAALAGTTVTLDAEDHTQTDLTLGIVRELRADHPSLGAVVQAYLKRTPDDCRDLAGPGSRVRLCKGAYSEPGSVAHRRKKRVNAAYLACLEILMRGQGRPLVATHDPRMISAAQAQAVRLQRGKDSFEFQMLYGVRSDEQARLAASGYHVRVYLPFGNDWYAYFTRRLAERPANVLFFLRALSERRRPADQDVRPRRRLRGPRSARRRAAA